MKIVIILLQKDITQSFSKYYFAYIIFIHSHCETLWAKKLHKILLSQKY